jgi:hypothetical protein
MRNQTAGKVSLRNVRTATAAALENEKLTRQRVDDLEAYAHVSAQHLTEMQAEREALRAGVVARLRWFLTGKVG